ncbi:translation initiation factor IF-5A [archaeon SCG-AAA382B04]|nr:translation initiation factor IF-5A [archaeon SCG-AAA382B04]
MFMPTKRTQIRNLDDGDYVLLDDEPCKIKDMKVSSPGKHGSAKANITAIGLFDGKTRNMRDPVDTKVDVPIVERKDAQVVSKSSDTVQLMDMDSYETFEVAVDDERMSELEEGEETKYMKSMGMKKII